MKYFDAQIYHVRIGHKVRLITPNARDGYNEYKPFSQFLKDSPNDFIAINCNIPSTHQCVFAGNCLFK